MIVFVVIPMQFTLFVLRPLVYDWLLVIVVSRSIKYHFLLLLTQGYMWRLPVMWYLTRTLPVPQKQMLFIMRYFCECSDLLGFES